MRAHGAEGEVTAEWGAGEQQTTELPEALDVYPEPSAKASHGREQGHNRIFCASLKECSGR